MNVPSCYVLFAIFKNDTQYQDISFYTIVILLYKLDYNEKLKYFSFLFKKFGSDELIAYAWQVGFTHIRCMKGNEWDKNVEKQSWLMLWGLNEVRVF